MTKSIPELLAPAGGPPEFNAALAAGADAIYCGYGNTFNARRGAQSFTATTFGEACRKAHLAGARVYVTVNVAIRDDELPTVLGLVRRAWLLGADAFIIQDWGLLREVHARWPEVECHISTQANVHDTRGVAWCKERGATRVTLSRELSMVEIAQIAQTGVDLECFCHGAICVCYSGVCQMSSCAGDRSANRGACAQPCRLPYELVGDDGLVLSPADRGRPLCPKDFYAFDDLPALVETGVRSLKIEGRLKGPDYLSSVVGAYRARLDDLAKGVEPTYAVIEARRTRLKRAFNRDFTNAYLQGTSGDELMSYERSNNRGELVGEVVDSRSFGSVKVRRGGKGGGRERLRTVGVAEVDISLRKPVNKGDLLEIRPVADPSQFITTLAPDEAEAGVVLTCRTSRAMPVGSLVRVIRSQHALDEGARLSVREVPRKRPVAVCIQARQGEAFCIELSTIDGAARVKAVGFTVEPALTRAVVEADLIKHVGRMGSTPFEAASFDVGLDEGCGMSFAAVHAVRAEACALLEQALLEPYDRRRLPDIGSLRGSAANAMHDAHALTPEACALVASPEAARAARDTGATRVYAAVSTLDEGAWPDWVVPSLDEVCRETDIGRLDSYVQADKPVAVGNVSELALASVRGALAEIRGCIPVHNRSCLAALVEAGATGVWLSPELSLEEIRSIARDASVPFGLVVLGRTRAMTTEHCVLQVAHRCVHDCSACRLRKTSLSLRTERGDLYPVRTDANGRSRVYAAHPQDLTPQVGELLEAGVTRFMADCTLLSVRETAKAVARVRRALDATLCGKMPDARLPGYTSGHLFAPIG